LKPGPLFPNGFQASLAFLNLALEVRVLACPGGGGERKEEAGEKE
jgi:hypothetical protein